ncbi:MAG: DNA-3-methyladenine glycosylase 2 family protein [Verrucomicrobia bacterium]|jgi:DNA-3-methyladenine glycosylase II|nr:DNA-3-methyladenine glycosylase 2 family protein [Verrucomicrobiota bacterium]
MRSQPKRTVATKSKNSAERGRILTSEACMAEGAAWLARAEPRFAYAIELCGVPPLRRRPDGFAQLLQAIVSQQVSTHAARAIWERMETAGLTEPAAILAADDAALRAPGLSRQKLRYARALAEAGIDFERLREAPDTEVVTTLTAVAGIGRWTAEIYAMFSLGRADVFAPGDLALQESARRLFNLPDRPREAALRRMAEAWSPWRSVAAGLLWVYYRAETNREGIT